MRVIAAVDEDREAVDNVRIALADLNMALAAAGHLGIRINFIRQDEIGRPNELWHLGRCVREEEIR